MELHTASRLGDEPSRVTSCERYLERLPLAAGARHELLLRVAGCAGAREGLMQVHRVIADRADETDDPARASIRHRLELAYGSAPANAGPTMTRSAQGKLRLLTTPRIKRTSMAPKSWPPKLTWWPFRPRPLPNERGKNETEVRPDAPNPRGTWHRSATIRRIALFALVVVPTGFATVAMAAILPYHGSGPLEMAMLILFAILFCWTSMGFWTATMGFLLLLSGRDRYAISRSASGTAPIPDEARTAIVMPICNEDVARVFVGLRATYESLARTGKLGHFDFFVLSDSSNPDIRTAEVDAWLNLCREAGGFGRVFYRWRKYRVKRKSGNIADFCRRWGADYRYMVVLDADSVMSGECLARLVQLMEANPNAGIIQTVPRSSGRATLYARIQQFANRVYGPLFTAGLHFWQLGESHYWGHNAIIRVVPFMRHCALGRLPGRGVLSGEILSHDFVEAALMRRAGWAVWIAYDLPGSHEQMPPNLLDELQRDRRWCLGNLINSRLFLAEGLHPAHRAVFATGVMAYFSALLWFLFLLLSTALLAMHTLVTPRYFTQPGQLFPEWPEWHFDWAVALGIVTLVLLFLPKILGVIVIWARGARRFRGWRLVLSMLAELFFSMLLAPIRMLFHTQFIVTAMMRGSAQWKSPPRRDSETTWAEALRRHGWHTLLGVAWTGGVYWLNPAFLWWLLPVVGALSLSIPISVYSSRTSAGERLRAAGLFLIPEEDRPPEELQWTQKKGEYAALPGFVDAVADPATNALMCAFGGVRAPPASVQNARRQLMHRALRDGPEALTAQQKLALLNDSIALSLLHFQVWTSPEAHPLWLRVRT